MGRALALAVIAALVAGMMIPLGAELKTEAQKEYEGWREAEFTNSTDILMGHLTYGMKIKVPTKKVEGWTQRTAGGTYNTVEEYGNYNGYCKYNVGGEKYHLEMWIVPPEYYESVSMTEKALKNIVNERRQKVDENKYQFQWTYFNKLNVVNKTHMIAHLFDMALEEETAEETIKQLNQSKIPGELKEMFKSNNSPLSKDAKVAQTSVEDYWFIVDGIERYAVWKNEDQLNVWSCCKAIEMTFTVATEESPILKLYYIQKGPVIYKFQLWADDMIYEDLSKIFWEPMLKSFQPMVEIT
jgi:hypothetical protein